MWLDINNINNCQYYLFAIDEIPIYKKAKIQNSPPKFQNFSFKFCKFVLYYFNSLRVHLDTVYFAENWKLKIL